MITTELKGIHGIIDGTEGVANLRAKQSHDCDHNDGDERKDDRVLNKALTFFLGSE
jgi:hypothetical protein